MYVPQHGQSLESTKPPTQHCNTNVAVKRHTISAVINLAKLVEKQSARPCATVDARGRNAPVYARQASASARSRTLPFAITGMLSAAFTACKYVEKGVNLVVNALCNTWPGTIVGKAS